MGLGHTDCSSSPWLAPTHQWAFGLLSPSTDCKPGKLAAPKQPDSCTGLTSHRLVSQTLMNTTEGDSWHTEFMEVLAWQNKDHAVHIPHSRHVTAALPHLLGYTVKPGLYTQQLQLRSNLKSFAFRASIMAKHLHVSLNLFLPKLSMHKIRQRRLYFFSV